MKMLRTARVFLLLGSFGSAPVSASPTYGQNLGAALGAFDDWRLVCAAGAGARAKVKDTTAEANPDNVAALMEVIIWEFGAGAPAIAGGEGLTSGWATVLTGPGTYTVRFEKSAVGSEAYEGWAECTGSNAVLTSFSRTVNN